ncbi:MAG: hypothetical protein ACI4HQ_06815 [Acetatifactor sp.]
MKKKIKFWMIWLAYVAVLALVIALLWSKIWKIMKEYEAAQPGYAVDALMLQLSDGSYAGPVQVEGNKFEPSDNIAHNFRESVKGRELTWKTESSGSQSVYGVYDGETKVAKATFEAFDQKQIMVILTISDWRAVSVEPIVKGQYSVHLELPEGFGASVNGIALTEEEQVGEAVPMEGMEYVAEYVNIPYYRTYEVKGLLEQPKVEVWDAEGNDVPLQEIAGSQTEGSVYARVTFAEQEMPPELEEYVVQAAKDYSNFFSRDLPGSGASTACLQKYFPENSYYIELAERYRQGDMWMYSDHRTPTFTNLETSEYIQYNYECFSCRVVFDKTLYLNRTGETRIEHNDQTYFYVLQGGKWVIADIKSNV